jgi:hypothetical protein
MADVLIQGALEYDLTGIPAPRAGIGLPVLHPPA